MGGGGGGWGGVADDQQRHCGQCNITEKVRMSLNSIEVNLRGMDRIEGKRSLTDG